MCSFFKRLFTTNFAPIIGIEKRNMAKTYKFVINDENVNEYGYRVLTDGIDTTQYMRNPVVLFMHRRNTFDPRGNEVIGRCVQLYKEGTQLIAEVEFDEDDEFAKAIAGKVERGFIRMASISADPVETSTAPEYIIEGQTHETVVKCKMDELSIVDIGGNDNALKLAKDGKEVQLNKIESKQNIDMSIQKIALVMGKDESADPSTVLQGVKDMKLAKEKAEKRAKDAEVKLAKIQEDEAEALTVKAIKLGLISEGLKTIQLGAFKGDHEGTKVTLSKLIADAEKDTKVDAQGNAVKEITLNKGVGNPVQDDPKETFDYLRRFDSVKLSKIRDEKPEQYAKMTQDYANGIRYKE